MKIRRYASSDIDEVIKLFYGTVHTVNAADYTSEQLDAWAPKDMDASVWDASLKRHYAVVAVEEGKIIGFGDIDADGYLDRLYVRAEYIGKGVGTAICDRLESAVRGNTVTHASVTARLFFEKRGYVVVKEQQVERKGILLANSIMDMQVKSETMRV